MDAHQIKELLIAHQNPRGIAQWTKLYSKSSNLSSYGIGLTVLRKLAKQVGKNHLLATQLWSSQNYDEKLLSLLIDEPKKMSREQVESQVEDIDIGLLVHVFSSCDAALAKTSFALELCQDWILAEDSVRRRCGYGLLYEISKWKTKKAPDELFFLNMIEHISSHFKNEDKSVHLSMGCALMGIGKRTLKLNQAALKLAHRLGPIEFESHSGQCEPFDVTKHLTSEYLQEKLLASSETANQ